jgi:hypothetical protein
VAEVFGVSFDLLLNDNLELDEWCASLRRFQENKYPRWLSLARNSFVCQQSIGQ